MPSKKGSKMTSFSGVFEHGPAGLLVPTHKILTPEPPKKKAYHVGKDGIINEVTKSVQDSAYDLVKDHYERKTGKAIVSKAQQKRLRDMVSRASESIVEKK